MVIKRLLFDTNIVVDAMRDLPAEINLIESVDVVNIAATTAAELIQGCLNKAELKRLQKVIETYNVVNIDEDICGSALELLAKYNLKEGLKFDDALIAATCAVYGYSLVTYDMRHFKNIKELDLYQI